MGYRCNSSTDLAISNADKVYGTSDKWGACAKGDSGTATVTDAYKTTRPTNTSVLFCIATKNIYLDPKNDYSTEEKVIGTWIDGKTLYQKTFTNLAFPQVVTDGASVLIAHDLISTDVSIVNTDIDITSDTDAHYKHNLIAYDNATSTTRMYFNSWVAVDNSMYELHIRSTKATFNNSLATITIQYTKTT